MAQQIISNGVFAQRACRAFAAAMRRRGLPYRQRLATIRRTDDVAGRAALLFTFHDAARGTSAAEYGISATGDRLECFRASFAPLEAPAQPPAGDRAPAEVRRLMEQRRAWLEANPPPVLRR